MAQVVAKAPTNSNSKLAALERRVADLESVVNLQAETLQRVVNSQVAVLAAFEALINEARKGVSDAET